jgi:hypothetical protein
MTCAAPRRHSKSSTLAFLRSNHHRATPLHLHTSMAEQGREEQPCKQTDPEEADDQPGFYFGDPDPGRARPPLRPPEQATENTAPPDVPGKARRPRHQTPNYGQKGPTTTRLTMYTRRRRPPPPLRPVEPPEKRGMLELVHRSIT